MLYEIWQVNAFQKKATTIPFTVVCWLFNCAPGSICCATAKTWRECYLEILWVAVRTGGGLCLSFMAYSSVTQLMFSLLRERQNKIWKQNTNASLTAFALHIPCMTHWRNGLCNENAGCEHRRISKIRAVCCFSWGRNWTYGVTMILLPDEIWDSIFVK